jgi:hypothetical protein
VKPKRTKFNRKGEAILAEEVAALRTEYRKADGSFPPDVARVLDGDPGPEELYHLVITYPFNIRVEGFAPTVTITPTVHERPYTREGEWTLKCFAWFFGKRHMERVFEPLVADLCNELTEAIQTGHQSRALLTRVRGYAACCCAALLLIRYTVVGKVIAVFRSIG